MIITHSNHDSWEAELGGTHRIDVNSAELSTAEFAHFLERIAVTLEDTLSNHVTLFFKQPLTIEQIVALTNYLSQHQGSLPFTKLLLEMNDKIANAKEFLALLTQLSEKEIARLELYLRAMQDSNDEHKFIESLSKTLLDTVSSDIRYPIYFYTRMLGGSVLMYQFNFNSHEKLVKQLVHKNQKRNFAKLVSKLDVSVAKSTVSHDVVAIPADENAEKIKLKALIAAAEPSHQFDEYIKLEVQHVEVEVVEQQQEQAQQVEEVVEQQVQLQEVQQQESRYDGELIDRVKFRRFALMVPVSAKSFYDSGYHAPRYDSILERSVVYHWGVWGEYFANLSGAIKFFSKNAATVIAKNLLELSSLNPDNLPANFVLKKTAQGETVLDYDPNLPEKKVNAFTPTVIINREDEGTYPAYFFRDSMEYKKYDDFTHNVLKISYHSYDNEWMKYGEEGVRYFINKMKECEDAQPGVMAFLSENYLRHSLDWSKYLEDPGFFEALDIIKAYDSRDKLICMMKFLEHISPSRNNLAYNLKYVLVAFEKFWGEWTQLCQKHDIDPGGVNTGWRKVEGGNPVVYMERLLTIFHNARNLNEQLMAFSSTSGFGVTELLYLQGYGAYYASRYEGFRVVHPRMNLFKQEAKEESGFNPKAHLHRVELEKLYAEATAPHEVMSIDEYFSHACRYIGQQDQSVNINHYVQAYDEFLKQINPFNKKNRKQIIFVSLMFVAHGRYDVGGLASTQAVKEMFQAIFNIQDKDILQQVMKSLYELYQADIRLSVIEGAMLCRAIVDMNTREFESLGLDKNRHLAKMMRAIKDGSYAALRMLTSSSSSKTLALSLVCALDTAEYLASDKKVSQFYADDLLLFSNLINAEPSEAYYIGRNDQHSEIITANLDKVKVYLHQAAYMSQPNNFYYAFKMMICAKEAFNYKRFLSAFDEIKELPAFDFKAVDQILRNNKFSTEAKQLDVFNGKLSLSDDIKDLMIMIIMALSLVKEKGLTVLPKFFSGASGGDDNDDEVVLTEEESARQGHEIERLNQLSIPELQRELSTALQSSGAALSLVGKAAISPLLTKFKTMAISDALLRHFGDTPIMRHLASIKNITGFTDHDDFEKLDRIYREANTLIDLLGKLAKRDNFKIYEAEFIEIFKQFPFELFDYKTMFRLLTFLESMPQRDYSNILRQFVANQSMLKNKDNCLKFIDLLSMLDRSHFPSVYIERIIGFAAESQEHAHMFAMTIIPMYEKNNSDPILEWIISNSALNMAQRIDIANIANVCTENRDLVCSVLKLYQAQSSAKLDGLIACLKKHYDKDSAMMANVLQLIARCSATTSVLTKAAAPIDCVKLIDMVENLGAENINKLMHYSKLSNINVTALDAALVVRAGIPNQSFDDFMFQIEKSPFGARDDAVQFDTKQVERVINEAGDINNDDIYTYAYRKKMMEAFLFVNKAGCHLPIYNNKPAKELSNEEIKALFHSIKAGSATFAHLDPFQRRLYALALMREAMYRSTGQFAYSTQIISLIDCMMHGGDVISNIVMGQGKSLIDTMKATLLWLESDRVDLSTSSIVDAERDISIYTPFLDALGIPHAGSPITASSSFDCYQANGINYGTMAQFALFYSKAKGEGVTIGNEDDRLSLVMNESDYTILDDRTIYRYAASNGAGVGTRHEWMYKEINAFITFDKFTRGDTSKKQDIAALRQHLVKAALQNNASPKLIKRLPDKQLLTWIESAIIVRYRLRENFDYVVTRLPEEKIIDGKPRLVRAAKILMKDGKVSPDALYGNGMHQLLHARLNELNDTDQFIIEPESKTIISLNNRNMIDYYRGKQGFIWGSSGTVGFGDEIKLQYQKYGFEFSKIEPHQKNIVKVEPIKVLPNQAAQFADILKKINRKHAKAGSPPALVFFKDIATAEQFFQALTANDKHQQIQLYTGIGNEADVVKRAAQPGMITVSTSALGRNTDILYDKSVGLVVYRCKAGIERLNMQQGGRTGRQGSPGEVHTILNQEDFPGMTVTEYAAKLERAAEVERQFNEDIYNILGYLFSKAEGMPNEFYRAAWASFTDELENNYRQQKIDKVFDLEQFVKKAVNEFNAMTELSITENELMAHLMSTHLPQAKHATYRHEVTVADCVPADVIAYQFAMTGHEDVAIDKEEVRAKLSAIFADTKNENRKERNREYIAYLNAGKSIKEIQIIHREFIADFLVQAVAKSKNRSAIKRWLGFQGHLSRLTNQAGYLMMFKALSEIQGEKLAANELVDPVRLSIITLLNEYLESSWFINKNKKMAARHLIADLNSAPDLAAVLKLVQQYKINIGKADIKTNRSSFWRRRIRPLHSKGHSRLQTALDNAIKLTSSLSNAKTNDDYVDALTSQLSEISKKPLPTFNSPDDLNASRPSFVFSDKYNANVFMDSLNEVLGLKLGCQPDNGMQGRFTVFSKAQENHALRKAHLNNSYKPKK